MQGNTVTSERQCTTHLFNVFVCFFGTVLMSRNIMSSFEFTPPEFWKFPPFFTLQPVEATRAKQLTLWKDLILKYHSERNIHTMTLVEFQYFENKAIGRRMNMSGITAIIESLILSGVWRRTFKFCSTAHTLGVVA